MDDNDDFQPNFNFTNPVVDKQPTGISSFTDALKEIQRAHDEEVNSTYLQLLYSNKQNLIRSLNHRDVHSNKHPNNGNKKLTNY
jgi:hypothetical protein